MKFLVAGAGAIGGYIGAKLARAGEDVTLFARGAHLAAMERDGVRVVAAEGSDETPFEARPAVTGDLASATGMDVIILGVKAHGLTTRAPQIAPLIGPNTTVLSTQNGVPWWYFENETGELAGLRLESVDPGGVIAASIPAKSVVGSLVYFATDLAGPGVVRHIEGNRISLGEPDGTRSDRIKGIAEAFIKAGLRVPVTTRLRSEMFVKLLGNAAFNPISALTRATLVKMALRVTVLTALGFDLRLVPGATPKKPFSGLMARNVPSGRGLIQAMSSPMVVTFQPSKPLGGTSIEKLVLPQAEGKAAAT